MSLSRVVGVALAPAAHAFGQAIEQLDAVVPADAGVGQRLAIGQRPAGDEVLAAADEMALDHHADDARNGLAQRLMIDASHANSQKKHENQLAVADSIAQQLEAGDARIVGVMVESHLVGGRQDLVTGRPLVYGQSLTDACLGWDDSIKLLDRLAEGVRGRRQRNANYTGK